MMITGDNMYQVMVFDEEHEDDLSDSINDFLFEHDEISLYDIKFSTAAFMEKDEQVFCFSAMIIYRYEDK